VDVDVTDQNGRRIIQLRGRSHNFGKPFLSAAELDADTASHPEG
jgi:hypothetical protein